jgi:hypothetical protein
MGTNSSLVFWPNVDESLTLSVCPHGDCSAPWNWDLTPNGINNDSFHCPAMDDRRAFFSGAPLLSCSIDDCASTVTRVELMAPPGESAASYGSLLALDDDHVYFTSDSRILRARKDGGGGTFQVIAREQPNIWGLAVSAASVYFTDVVRGLLLTCPTTGCLGDPVVMARRTAHHPD